MNNQTHTTTRPDGATIPAGLHGGCMVAALASRLALERGAARDLDEAIAAGRFVGGELIAAQRELNHTLDAENAVRTMIAANRATKLEGAAIQIVEILPLLDGLFEAISEPRSEEYASYRAAYRLIFSALDAVEAHCQHRLDHVIDPQYWQRNLNPWISGPASNGSMNEGDEVAA